MENMFTSFFVSCLIAACAATSPLGPHPKIAIFTVTDLSGDLSFTVVDDLTNQHSDRESDH